MAVHVFYNAQKGEGVNNLLYALYKGRGLSANAKNCQKWPFLRYIICGRPISRRKRRRTFRIDTEVRCVGAHPPFGTLSRRGLNPMKPVYDPVRPDVRLNLTTSAFNQLGQYTNTSSPGRRGYCYAELADFFPSGGRNHRQYSLRLPTEGWPG